jgi:hypothetical protein
MWAMPSSAVRSCAESDLLGLLNPAGLYGYEWNNGAQ